MDFFSLCFVSLCFLKRVIRTEVCVGKWDTIHKTTRRQVCGKLYLKSMGWTTGLDIMGALEEFYDISYRPWWLRLYLPCVRACWRGSKRSINCEKRFRSKENKTNRETGKWYLKFKILSSLWCSEHWYKVTCGKSQVTGHRRNTSTPKMLDTITFRPYVTGAYETRGFPV